jgi:heat shock protein HslJ
MLNLLRLSLAFLTLLILSGCAGIDSTADPTALLMGEEWTVEDIDRRGVIDRSHISIQFLDQNRVAGRASCNRFMGGFTATGDQGLRFSTLASTKMACPEALMKQEQLFLQILEQVERYEIDSTGTLRLVTGDGRTLTARR